MTDKTERTPDDIVDSLFAAIEKTRNQNPICTEREKILIAALEASVVLIDDLLAVHVAPEFMDDDTLTRARERINKGGTLGYIADVQKVNRKVLGVK